MQITAPIMIAKSPLLRIQTADTLFFIPGYGILSRLNFTSWKKFIYSREFPL